MQVAKEIICRTFCLHSQHHCSISLSTMFVWPLVNIVVVVVVEVAFGFLEKAIGSMFTRAGVNASKTPNKSRSVITKRHSIQERYIVPSLSYAYAYAYPNKLVILEFNYLIRSAQRSRASICDRLSIVF